MKRVLLQFALYSAVILTASLAVAQENLSGIWEGIISLPGLTLDMAIDIQQEDGTWVGTMDIPKQNIKDMKLVDLTVSSDSISFVLPEVPGNASYKGAVAEDGNNIAGTFSQGGQELELAFIKKSMAEQMEEEEALKAKVALIQHLADSFRVARSHPGLAFGIVMDGKVLFAEGFGHRDSARTLDVDSETLFAIGSSSKAFTTMGLALLEDEGTLEWDEPIIHYMPDFRLMDEYATQEMNAIDLTSHRSGLPRHDLMWYGTDFSRQEIYDRLRYLEPNKSFRSTWQYQNLMYMTAGHLIGTLSGQSWEDFTDERILTPLGMDATIFSTALMETADNAALGHRLDDEKVSHILPYRNLDAIGPAGSINSSIDDMMKWAALLTNQGKIGDDQLVSASNLAFMQAPQMVMPMGATRQKEFSFPSYGLGWMTYSYDGTRIVAHGGNIDGFSALVWTLPDDNIAMVALTNVNGSGLPSVLSRTATDILLDNEPIDWYARSYAKQEKEDEEDDEEEEDEEDEDKLIKVEGTTYQHDITKYAGSYSHPGYGTIVLVEKDGKLSTVFNTLAMDFEHWHFETFSGHIEEIDTDMLLTFSTSPQGKIESFGIKLEQFTPDIVFSRDPEAKQSDPEYLSLLTGAYDLGPQTVRIKLKGTNTLTATLPGQPVYELVPYQDNEFKLKGLDGFSAEFLFAAEDEPATGIKFIQPNGVFEAKRKKE